MAVPGNHLTGPAKPWVFHQHEQEPPGFSNPHSASRGGDSYGPEQGYLSQECLTRLQSLDRKVVSGQPVLNWLLSQLLGKIMSCIGIVPWAHLHCRTLQWLLPYQRAHKSSSHLRIQLPPKICLSLCWWSSPALLKGRSFRNPHYLVLTTDGSLYGWGAHLGSDFAQGQWTPTNLANGINWLELWAIHLALSAFQPTVQDHHILVKTDNVASKAHINRLGGTHSHLLMREAIHLGLWAERHLGSIRASHISGTANTQADLLSRTTVDHGEWRLHPTIFNDILCFNILVVDLFASSTNFQMSRFFFDSRRWEQRKWTA